MTEIDEIERGHIPTAEGFYQPVRTAILAIEASLELMVDGDGSPVVQYVDGTSGTYGTRHTGIHYTGWSGIDDYALRVYDDRIFCELPLQIPKEAPLILHSTNWEGGKNATTRSDLQSSYPSGDVTWLQWRQWNQVQGGFEVVVGPDLDLGGATPPTEVTFGIWRGQESTSRVGMEFYSTKYLGVDYQGIKCHRSGEDAYFANWTLDYRYNDGSIHDITAIEFIPNDSQEPTQIDTKIHGDLEVSGDISADEVFGRCLRSDHATWPAFYYDTDGTPRLEVYYDLNGSPVAHYGVWSYAYNEAIVKFFDNGDAWIADDLTVGGVLYADSIQANGEIWVDKDSYGNYKGFKIDEDGYVTCEVDGSVVWRARENALTAQGELIVPNIEFSDTSYLHGTGQQITHAVTSQEWGLLRFICAPDEDIHNANGYGKEATFFLGRGKQDGSHEDIDLYNMNYGASGTAPTMGLVMLRGGADSKFGTFNFGYRVGVDHTSAFDVYCDDDENPTYAGIKMYGPILADADLDLFAPTGQTLNLGVNLTDVVTVAADGVTFAQDIVLGAQTIGYDNTGGLSFDASNNATFSAQATITGQLTCNDTTLLVQNATNPGVTITQTGTGQSWRYYNSGTTFIFRDASNSRSVLTLDNTTGDAKFLNAVIYEYDDNFKTYKSTYPYFQLDTGDWWRLNSDVHEWGIGGTIEMKLGQYGLYLQDNNIYDVTYIYGAGNLSFIPDVSTYTGYLKYKTGNTAGNAWLDRITVLGGADTADIDITNAVLDLNGCDIKSAVISTTGSETEGGMRWNATSHKLEVYNGSAWETVTSST
jgi:hypothetical protein